jgi:DNA-directed RNA polymerase specialized sigma24 family protein
MVMSSGMLSTGQIIAGKALTDEMAAQEALQMLQQAVDLRRSHRRDVTDRIVERSQALPPFERSMVEAIYLRRMTATAVAREMRVQPRTVRRVVREAVRRVLSPLFAYVLQHREGWTGHRRQVAQLCHIEGMSLRAAAKVIGISFHTIRRHDEAVRLMFEAFETQRRRAS